MCEFNEEVVRRAVHVAISRVLSENHSIDNVDVPERVRSSVKQHIRGFLNILDELDELHVVLSYTPKGTLVGIAVRGKIRKFNVDERNKTC